MPPKAPPPTIEPTKMLGSALLPQTVMIIDPEAS